MQYFFYSIGSTIHIAQESLCLLYAGFFLNNIDINIDQVDRPRVGGSGKVDNVFQRIGPWPILS